MNRKLIMLLIIAASIIFTFLISQYGSAPYDSRPVYAKYMNFESDEITLIEDGDSVKYYYYLPYLEKNEIKSVNIYDFVNLDPDATNDKTTLSYSIIYDNEEEKDYLSLVTEGVLKGRLTIKGQTSATITIQTTDGSGISVQLYIRPNRNTHDDHYDDDIFK